jgi:hypothetical protein
VKFEAEKRRAMWKREKGQRREVETKSLCYQSLKEGEKKLL